MFSTQYGLLSVEDIKQKINDGDVSITFPDQGRFLPALLRGLIKINFKSILFVDESGATYFVIKSINNEKLLDSKIDKYYPLLLVPFADDSILSHNYYINENHFLGKWILLNQDFLIENYDGYFTSLIRFVCRMEPNAINRIIEYFSKVLPEEIKPQIGTISKADFVKNSGKAPF